MVINTTTRWTPDKEVLEALSESAAMTTFVIPSPIVVMTIASVKQSIPTMFAALPTLASWMISSEVAEIRSVSRSEAKSAAIRRVRTAKSMVITVLALIEAIACRIHAEPTMIVSMTTFTSA
jgi:hypothetical protein